MTGFAALSSRRVTGIALAVMLVWLAAAGSASAGVQVYNEPAYTKTPNNNSYWWRWTRIVGTANNQNPDSNQNNVHDSLEYYLCFSTSRDGGIVLESHSGSGGPGSAGCEVHSAFVGNIGDFGAYPLNGTATTLQDGSEYTMCAVDFWRSVFIWNSGTHSCESTRIDKTQPSVVTDVNGTAEYTNNPQLNFHLSYSDATSPPWPANYVCISVGANTCGSSTFNYDANCSVPAGAGFDFYCTGDASAQPDGPIYFCAAAADSAIPDNPTGTNQFVYASNGQPVTSNTANISNAACGHVTLDRTPPHVSVSASSMTVNAGDLVTFTASANDATSGVPGGYTWTFGDNTASATGSSVTHTYTQPGTYVAKATTSDGAGNAGEGTTTITVNPVGSGTAGGGTGGNTIPGGSSSGGTLTQQAPTPNQISNQVGGGGTQTQDVGGLGVVAPKRVTIKKSLKSLPVALSPTTGGKVDLALVRKGKIVAKSAAVFADAGTFGLKMALPKKMKPGTYSLKVSFTPSGQTSGVSKTLKVKFVKKGKKGRRSSAARTGGVPDVTGGPRHDAPEPKRSRPIVIR